MSSPSSCSVPLTRQPSMVSFMRFRQRRNVDLPQPEGPIIAMIWFGAISRLTRCIAWFSP
jgi:hypothetical protein